MKTASKILIFILITGLTVSAAYAQFAKPEHAIKYRKAVMFLIAQHFKRMGAVVQGKTSYDKQTFTDNAVLLEMLATLPWEASMEPGTDKGDTTLSAAVFKKPEAFEKAADDFEAATAKLARLAAAGDLEGSKTQFGAVAASCKSCHGQFRSK